MFLNKGTLVLKQLSFIDTLLMLFGCFYLLQFISEEVTNFSIDDTNLQFLSLFLFTGAKQPDLKKTNIKNIKYNTMYCNFNNILRGFHSSVCLLSDKDLVRRIEKLKSNSIEEKDISLDAETVENMKKSLSDLKSDISIKNVSDEIKEVTDYLNNSNNNTSSFDQAFPNYAKDKGLVDEEVKNQSVFEVVKEVKKILEECASNGYPEECIEKLKVSNIIDKVLSKDSSDSLEKKVGDEIVNELTTLEKIGNITLSEIYNKSMEFKDKFNIKPNYVEMGLSLISYGLLLKSYNKYIDKRPLPTNVTLEELRTIKNTRAISRF